MGTFFI